MATTFKSVLIIDPLAESQGHLLDDDLFWAEHLITRFEKLCIISSRDSIKRIKEIVPGAETRCFSPWPKIFNKINKLSHIKYIIRMLINTCGFQVVLVQSFHELSALIFTFIKPNKDIYLVVTNNLTGEGALTVRKKKLQKILFKRVSGLMIGSRFEKRLISEIYPEVPQSKVHVLPYYKISQQRTIVPLCYRKHRIVFLGFARKDRGLDNFLNWASYDKTDKYSYGIYGNITLSQEQQNIIKKITAPFEIIKGYLPDGAYFKLISESLFVALPFNRSFEGRLSGILCDAIACGTPVLASKIEPHIDLFEKYGAFGYLLEVDDIDAWHNFLLSDVTSQWDSFQNSLMCTREANSPDNVMSVVMNAMKCNSRSVK